MSLAQVSKLAGVSIATVSRVINRHPGVNAAMAQAVHRALQQTGYSVPSEGRVGRPRRSPVGVTRGSIAVLIPDSQTSALRTSLSGKILHAVQDALRSRNMSMVVSGLMPDGQLPACIVSRQVDGVIMRSGMSPGSAAECKIPHVWVFERPHHTADADVVLEDNSSIGQLALNYLRRSGHRKLAIINIAGNHPSFNARRSAFIDVAAEAGLEVAQINEPLAGAQLSARLTQVLSRATGLFVPGADDEVRTIYRALQSLNVSIGKDVTLISCNNDEECLATLDPRLANIDIQAEEIARTAVETLLWRLKHRNEPRRKILIEPKLIESTVQ